FVTHVDANTNFSVTNNFTVDDTFIPSSSTVISGTGTVSGTATIKVTGTATNSLSSQYTLTRDLSALTVEYAGSAAQSVDSTTYKNLTINNSAGVSLVDNVTVTGVLNLASGFANGDANVTVTNSAPSAVTATAGWFSPGVTLKRAIAIGDNTYSFPVGVGSASMTVSVTFHSVTAAG